MSQYKDNKNAPNIRFVRINGHVVPMINGQHLPKAGKMVEKRIDEMTAEVQHAEAGQRGVGFDEHRNAIRNFGTKSTFPKWYGDIKFKNKEDFYKTVMQRTSNKFDQVAQQAIGDLKEGHDSPHGRVPPDMDFRVATRQTFNNKGVSFKNIDGIVRPIRRHG